MDECEIRAKAAELSVALTVHLIPVIIGKGTISKTEIMPLGYATEFEQYILYGTIPEPISITRKICD